MKIEKKIFYSRFARRMFVFFVFCALLPVSILAVVTFQQVTSSLEEQYSQRMQQMAKSVAVTLYERLLMAETNFEVLISDLNSGVSGHSATNRGKESFYDQWFNGVALVSLSGEKKGVLKDIDDLPEIEKNHDLLKAAGKTRLLGRHTGNLARLFMVRQLDYHDYSRGFIVAELNNDFLWGVGHFNTIPHQTRLCVVDQFRSIYLNSFQSTENLFREMGKKEMSGSNDRSFSFEQNGIEYLANFQPIFMRSRFLSPDWVVILSQERSEVFEPLTYFKQVFPLVILLSIWIILLLSIYFIRNSLLPLEKLKEGTARIAKRDFSTRVAVTSNDEFADLAESFNDMSGQLKKQFETMAIRAKIDRAILSSLDTEEIVNTMLDGIYGYLECGVTAVGLVGGATVKELKYFIKFSGSGQIAPGEKVAIKAEQVRTLLDEGALAIVKGEGVPSFMAFFESSSARQFDVIPAIANDALVAVIIVGYNEELPENRDGDLLLLSQLASQMAVALENSRLIDDLEKLSWGAIEGFGRTVDAKSSWTAGHSQRVTKYAMQIAHAMDLPGERLKLLHRASYLHDIGKIGIPITILDKSEPLTEEESARMKLHPSTGAKILEPIRIFDEITPIIRQHHENYDGSGYPEGLKGEQISVEARILRVADVFDALASVRPYRKEWDREKIVCYLQDQADKEFDREIVAVLLKLLAEDGLAVNPLLLF